VFEEAPQIDFRKAQHQFAGLDLGKIRHLVDQLQEMAAAAEHVRVEELGLVKFQPVQKGPQGPVVDLAHVHQQGPGW